jgi:ribonuclease BN (tRNA processing enzyme)
MRITFLGTNGWHDSKMGNTLCILLNSEQYNIILDAGSGLAKADRFLDQSKQTFIFLSHFHLDHIAGLHTLAKFRFTQPLVFLVGEGLTGILESFVAKPFTCPLDQLPFKTKIMELPGQQILLPFPAKSLDLPHPDPTIGIRLTLEDKIITFCPDTGYCQNCVELARNADILITECAYKPGETCQTWPHLNPETAARIAQEAEAKKLILTHFDASRYLTIKDRNGALSAARITFPETQISTDDWQLDI